MNLEEVRADVALGTKTEDEDDEGEDANDESSSSSRAVYVCLWKRQGVAYGIDMATDAQELGYIGVCQGGFGRKCCKLKMMKLGRKIGFSTVFVRHTPPSSARILFLLSTTFKSVNRYPSTPTLPTTKQKTLARSPQKSDA